jgi:hypothetical protein
MLCACLFVLLETRAGRKRAYLDLKNRFDDHTGRHGLCGASSLVSRYVHHNDFLDPNRNIFDRLKVPKDQLGTLKALKLLKIRFETSAILVTLRRGNTRKAKTSYKCASCTRCALSIILAEFYLEEGA